MNNDYPVYTALGAAATGYAAVLNTPRGKEFTDEYTWATVVAGTSLVLAALYWLLPRSAWLKVVTAFVVAGSPMVARSLINKRFIAS